jgi:DNA-binding transcriptional LysR family regulator
MVRTGITELSAFIAIAEQRSFRAAARTLEVSPSALSHSMRGLEARLGVRLFNRTTRSVALTEAGEQLLNRVRPAIAELDSAVADLMAARDQPSGSIRISASESGAAQLIRHVLPGFIADYPEIHVEIVADGRLVDIVAEGFDAGVRLLESIPLDMIAVRFGTEMRMIAVAAPGYLATRRPPKAPHDLNEHRCIRFRFASGAIYRWDLERRGKSVNVDVPGPVTLGNTNLSIEAAVAGIGIAWVPEDQVAELLAAGRLVHLLKDWSPCFPGLCLYYPANRHPPPALRLFAKAVREWANTRGEAR